MIRAIFKFKDGNHLLIPIQTELGPQGQEYVPERFTTINPFSGLQATLRITDSARQFLTYQEEDIAPLYQSPVA